MSADDHEPSDLERAVRDQLTAWHLLDSPEGRAVLDIAHRLAHTEDLRPAAAAMLHAQLRALVADLRKLAPPVEAADEVADLRAQYEGLRAVQ
jgi:hypothetical protein